MLHATAGSDEIWKVIHADTQACPRAGAIHAHDLSVLMQAVQASQAGLVENLQGMWCDAVVVLVGWEWPHARQAMCHPATASTAAAVQAWLQVCNPLCKWCAPSLYMSLLLLLMLLPLLANRPFERFFVAQFSCSPELFQT